MIPPKPLIALLQSKLYTFTNKLQVGGAINIKLLFISPAYYPGTSYGGPVSSAKVLCESLCKKNIDVTVYTTAFGLPKNTYSNKIINRVKIHYFPLTRWLKWPGSIPAIKTLFKKHTDFDLVHVNMLWDPISWMSGYFLSFTKTPYIISSHGSLIPSLVNEKNRLFKWILYFLVIKRILLKAKSVHFTTSYELEQFNLLSNNLKINHFIVPSPSTLQNSIQPSLLHLKKHSVDKLNYFLYVGRINWKKGLDLLITAFSMYLMQTQNKSTKLVIVGPDENQYKKTIVALIDKLKISENIIFTGVVSENEKISLLANSIAFCLPSISENYGIAVIEALYYGTPALISPFVGVQDILKKYGAGIIVKRDAGLITKELRLLATKTQIRKKLIKNGKLICKTYFNNEIIVSKMIAKYNILALVIK